MSRMEPREPKGALRCVECGGKPWISLAMVGLICEDCYDARGLSSLTPLYRDRVKEPSA